ncbi:MAG: SpoIID/LytB domain-containing protein, partial [Gemmatimonadaceae bacterium]
VATVINQVYGGADAETPLTDSAVAATAGLVLTYGGRVISAPYHSTCGGSTAAAAEIWQRTPDEPFLRAVSDRIPGTDRHYCDRSPRFRWTATLERGTLSADLERYLRRYAAVSGSSPGVARSVEVDGHTPSGRVRSLVVGTDRGRYVLRGNDIRFVMRTAGGDILNSTYFSVEPELAPDGAISRLTFRGGGWGHGVGMCQWGAFGRARAGQDFRSILQTYYPGTTVEPLD